jgi:phenylacetate-CoA ligase
MNDVLIESVYAKLPIFLQNSVCWYHGRKQAKLRFSDHYDTHVEKLLESEWWSAAEIEAYQNEKLRDLITHAFETVPFYRQRMKELKLTPNDIRTVVDLNKLPILTKEDVRNNRAQLVSEKAQKGDLVHRHTSGTTGKSLQFYSSRLSTAFQWAVWRRHQTRFGITPMAMHANFTGRVVVPIDQMSPPYWRWNRPMRQALITMQHLTPEKIEDIVSFLNDNEFEFYSGYPSIVHAFTVAAKSAGLTLSSPPRVVVTGAENILAHQRRDIEDFTRAVITDQYGISEGCGNASQCPEFVYHEDFEFGILECVDSSVSEDGRKTGRILCTGFACPEFPFIRYEVGDIGTWEAPGQDCPCGRQSRMIVDIDGRIDDHVVTPEGNLIMRFDYVFKDATNIQESQVVQDRLGEIRVRIVKRPTYRSIDEQFVNDEIHRWISPTIKVNFEYVSMIEREPNGKFRAVQSNIKTA